MREALTVHDEERARYSLVESWFRSPLPRTDWAAYLAGDLTSAELHRQLLEFEPVRPGRWDLVNHTLWVLQQRLRLALRRERNLPLVLDDFTCGSCGQAPVDSAHLCCLSCTERDILIETHLGSRGSCAFTSPMWSVEYASWGIVFYSSIVRMDDPLLAFLAVGYTTYGDALAALYPAILFEQWTQTQTGASGDSHWHSILSVCEAEPLLTRASPAAPQDFRDRLFSVLLKRVTEFEPDNCRSIREAINEYTREHERR